MASIFDFHAQLAIEHHWLTEYGPNAEAFKALFARDHVDEDILDAWHGALVGPDNDLDHMGVGVAYAAGIDRLPWIGIETSDTPAGPQFLGDTLEIREGIEYKGGFFDQTVAIHVFGSSQLTRAMHVLVRGIFYRSTERFLKLGYENITYAGGGTLEPHPKLVEEYGGIMQRVQRWRATGLASVPMGAIARKDVRVHSADTEIDGNPGGAKPWEE